MFETVNSQYVKLNLNMALTNFLKSFWIRKLVSSQTQSRFITQIGHWNIFQIIKLHLDYKLIVTRK